MGKRTRRGAGLMPAAVAEIRRLREEWAALKHSDLLSTDRIEENRVLKPLNYNRPTTNKRIKPVKRKPAMSLSKPLHSDILVGVVALVEDGNEYRALALRAALTALGASVVPNWSALVTHVVWGEGGSTSIRAKARTYAAKLVSPLWVEACVSANDWLPERAFPTAARDSDLPSPRTVLQLLREAEARKVPLQVLLTGLTAGDGCGSAEPEAGATTTRAIANMYGNNENTPSGTAGAPGYGNTDTEGAIGSGSCTNIATDHTAYAESRDDNGNIIADAAGRTPGFQFELDTEPVTGHKFGAKAQTADHSPRSNEQRNRSSKGKQADSNKPQPLLETDARNEAKEALRPGGDSNEFKNTVEKNLACHSRAMQCGNNDDKTSNSSFGPGTSVIGFGPPGEGADAATSRPDREIFGPSGQTPNSSLHGGVSRHDDEFPPDPADRLGAKPKTKQKKYKKKKSEDTPPPAVNVVPTNTSDSTTEEISYVNTLPRRALPASLSPLSPPPSPPSSPPPPLPFRYRGAGPRSPPGPPPSPPSPPSRSSTPPLHGYRRWPPKKWPRSSSPTMYQPTVSQPEPYGTAPPPTRSPPRHGHRRCRARRSPPRDRYKSPTPGPSSAPHVPPQLREERRSSSPGPSRISPLRAPSPSSPHRSPSPGPSKGRYRSPSPGPSWRPDRAPSPGPWRRRNRCASPGPSRGRDRSPFRGPSLPPRPRTYFPFSTRARANSRAPSPPTQGRKPLPVLRVTPIKVHPDPEAGASRPPFLKPPRPQFNRRSRSSSVPNSRFTKPMLPPPPAQKKRTRRKLFLYRLFDDCQREEYESASDPEQEGPDEEAIWGGYWNNRRRRNYRAAQERRSHGLFPPSPPSPPPPLQPPRRRHGPRERTLMEITYYHGVDGDPEHEPEAILMGHGHDDVAQEEAGVRPNGMYPSPRNERRALARAERTARRYIDRPGTPAPETPPERPISPVLYPNRLRIVLTGMSADERVRVTDACTYLGASIQHRVTRNTTHVLIGSFGSNGMMNNADGIPLPDLGMPLPIIVRLRTVNALAGAARGCRVLRAQWALDSRAAEGWLPHHRYQISYLKAVAEKAAAERHAFGLTRVDYAYNVFHGRRIIIAAECEQRDAVIELLALCGAIIYDHEGHIIRNQETLERQNVNRSIQIGYYGRDYGTRLVPPRTGRTEDGGWAGSNLEHSSDVTLGSRPDQISSRWVFDSVASGRMRSLRRYIIPQSG